MVDLRENLKIRSPEFYSKFLHIENESKKIMSNFRVMFSTYTNHDVIHSGNVERNANEIITEEVLENITPEEIFCLLSAIWLHDVGMIPIGDEKERFEGKSKEEREELRIAIRDQHHIRSNTYISNHKEELNINDFEVKAIGNICKGHRRIDLNSLDDVYTENIIRVDCLAAILRLADECDVSKERESHLSTEGVNSADKEKHYKIHDIVKSVQFNQDNNKIIIVANISQEDHIEKLIDCKKNICNELNYVRPFLEKIDIRLNNVEFQTTMSSNLLKKKLILCMAKQEDIYGLVSEFITNNDIDDELGNLITNQFVNNESLTLTHDFEKFKEIFNLFSDKDSIEEFFFTDYVQDMISELYLKIENNFNVDLDLEDSSSRKSILKNSPTALYFLLFMDKIIKVPNFNTSSNQNGTLMLDSILLFGLFNDIHHYDDNIDFDEVEDMLLNLKIFDKDYVLTKVEGYRLLGDD